YAEQIQALLPEARFIHLIRDGRDVALSYQKAGANNLPLYESARDWAAQVRATRRQVRELSYYLEVRYENLMLEPEKTLRRICEFLDLAWDPAILVHISESPFPVRTTDDRQSTMELSSTVHDPSSTEPAKHELSL